MGITGRSRPEELLQSAASSLKKQSPGMSLRAVAGRLKISPSYWSKILRGEKPLSKSLLPRVVKVLGMDAQQTAQLQRSLLEKIENDRLVPGTGIRTTQEVKGSPIENYRNLGRKDFWLLEEWYYIPILNIFTLTRGDHSPNEISKRIGVSVQQINETIHNLIQSGFLKQSSDGQLVRTDLQVRFPTDRSHRQIRRYHGAMIKKAREVITKEDAEQSFESRLVSAVCFAGSSEKLKEARLIIEEAMYRAANLMAGEPCSDQVYQLNVQVFPLTK